MAADFLVGDGGVVEAVGVNCPVLNAVDGGGGEPEPEPEPGLGVGGPEVMATSSRDSVALRLALMELVLMWPILADKSEASAVAWRGWAAIFLPPVLLFYNDNFPNSYNDELFSYKNVNFPQVNGQPLW